MMQQTQQPQDQRGAGPGPRRIRLLIVDDMLDMAKNVQKLVHFEPDIQVVGVATSGREALAKVTALTPDVVLMDINLPDINGLKATEMITSRLPVSVIIMSVQSEGEYVASAFDVGASNYIIKPFTGDELTFKIRKAYEALERRRIDQQPAPPLAPQQPAPSQAQRKIIAIYSPKGGVGRSVIAANLAVVLRSQTNARVALVDANLQSGDAHVLLNINTPNSIDDLRTAGALDQEIIYGAVAPHESGIGLLRAPVEPQSAEFFTADAMKAILVEMREHFDYLVVDTDTTFSDYTLTVLEMADLILTPTTLEMTTLNRVTQFFDVMERLNYARTKIKLICNRVDPLYGIQPKYVESRFRQHFMAQIPDEPKLVVASVDRGVPFVTLQKNAQITKTIQKLAERVVTVLAPNPPGAPSKKR